MESVWPGWGGRFGPPSQRKVRDYLSRLSNVRRWNWMRRKAFWATAVVAGLTIVELETSFFQSHLLAAAARRMTYGVQPGASRSIHYPDPGPYDLSLGYSNLPAMLDRLEERGFEIEAQARVSPIYKALSMLGVYPIYREKTQAGLRVVDAAGIDLFEAKYPRRIYPGFESIPPIVVESLLFAENREAMNDSLPYRNPSVEWDRFAKAMIDVGVSKLDSKHPVSGGSTLATQLEKMRHSPGGRTESGADKFRQMTSASLRAYRNGERTAGARRQIVRDYINALPLAAPAGFGEAFGLGDGLWAWYGADFDEVNSLLARIDDPEAGELLPRQAVAFRQVLSLLLAVKRPTALLVKNPELLDQRVDSYLRLLTAAGRISPSLRDAALAVRSAPRKRAPEAPVVSFIGRKAVNAVRAELLRTLGAPSLYELDRLDLTARSTLDAQATNRVAAALEQLADPARAASAGLIGERLLSGEGAGDVTYSFTLYERVGNANVLRVQADNYDQPLNINEGTRLELGSTAKLRTLVHYLEIVAELHRDYGAVPAEELALIRVPAEDRIARWAVDYLRSAKDPSLPAMLEAAMLRTYSANPGERFFTGGGMHQFGNFDAKDNHRVLTLREAFQRSVNLPFIRLMRDLTRHHMQRLPSVSPAILEDERDPSRLAYLARFADWEGGKFMAGFWSKHHGRPADESVDLLLKQSRPTAARRAILFRTAKPGASVEEFAKFLKADAADAARPKSPDARTLYEEYAPGRFSWNDLGFLTRVHPLELWTVNYLAAHPDANLEQLLSASAVERQRSYEWLLKSRDKRARDQRILTLIEKDAFDRIHAAWRRVGYPFRNMTPSYAAAIGSSGDNPAALAELMGILVNRGMRYPTVRIESLHFGAGTPVETLAARRIPSGERVLPTEVADATRRELLGVVERGTARRALGAVALNDGTALALGGKTGTGDNRMDVFAPGHRLVESKVVNRTATFVFFIDDRFFGVVMAYVDGPGASRYRFTSALPVQVFRGLAAAIRPVVERGRRPDRDVHERLKLQQTPEGSRRAAPRSLAKQPDNENRRTVSYGGLPISLTRTQSSRSALKRFARDPA